MSQVTSKVKDLTTGVKLSRFALSPKRAISKADLDKVAKLFGANATAIGGDRLVINTELACVSPVYSLLRDVKSLVGRWSIDYPESGLRLMRIDKVEPMLKEAESLRKELDAALDELVDNWEEVKARARVDIKELYNEADYAVDVKKSFGFAITFPAIEPDRRLAKEYPELYEQERQRIAAKLDQAFESAQASVADTFAELLQHLGEQLSGVKDDGKPKTLRASAVDNIRKAVAYFKNVTLGDDERLESAVQKIDVLVNGIDLSLVKKRPSHRKSTAEQVAALSQVMSELVVERRRQIGFEAFEEEVKS